MKMQEEGIETPVSDQHDIRAVIRQALTAYRQVIEAAEGFIGTLSTETEYYRFIEERVCLMREVEQDFVNRCLDRGIEE